MVVRPWSAALVALAVLLGAAAVRADQPQGKRAAARDDSAGKRAMALNDEAWALYEQGRYRAAIERLTQAESLDPKSKDLVYNLALIHEKLADLPEATTYYRRFIDMETDPKARARIQATLQRLEGARREREEAASAAARLSPRATAAPSPPDAPRPLRPVVIATGGLAGASFLLGAVFGLSALARRPGADPRTGAGTTIQDLQDDARVAHTHAIVADVSFAVALGAAGAATVLYFTTPRGAVPGRVTARWAVAPGLLRVAF